MFAVVLAFFFFFFFTGADIKLRLSDGGEAHGRLEVLYEGTWGTVCHDYFDQHEAKVVCYQLGFPRNGQHGFAAHAAFGQGSGPIWLDNLGCLGGEANLKDCNHVGWGTHDHCDHSDDASVYCDQGNLI